MKKQKMSVHQEIDSREGGDEAAAAPPLPRTILGLRSPATSCSDAMHDREDSAGRPIDLVWTVSNVNRNQLRYSAVADE